MSQPVNRLIQYAHTTGGAPYDEEAYMPYDNRRGGANTFLDARLYGRLPDRQLDYMTGGMTEAHNYGMGYYPSSRFGGGGLETFRGPPPGVGRDLDSAGGSDMDMMRMYGPEDQVVFDASGRPIPLADPRHPRNQQQQMAPSYPQRR